MNIKNIFPFLLLLSVNGFSQQHLINGTVFSAATRKPIEKVHIVLHMPDSKIMEFTTDSSGTYSFKASGPGKFFITAEKCIKGKCAWGECYLVKKFVIDSNALKQDNSIFCDLTLMPVKQEIILPTIYFKKNTAQFDSCSYCSNRPIDSTLFCLSEMLLLNPKMQICINGYANENEKDAEKLSGERALTVKKILLKNNVNETRVSVKAFGTNRLTSKDPTNRIVTFSIIKF